MRLLVVGIVAVIAGCSDPLGALLPKCAQSSECPDGYSCVDGNCARGGPGSSSGAVSSSSASLSSSSVAPSSSMLPSSSSAMPSSSSAASSSSSSQMASSSSSAAMSSSGPLCAPYTNTAYERAAPFAVNQGFTATFCREQTANRHFWLSDEDFRAGTDFTLSVRRGIGDAGVPPQKVSFGLAQGTLDGGFEPPFFNIPQCNNGQTLEMCQQHHDAPGGVFVFAQAGDDAEREYIHESDLLVTSTGPCAQLPQNTAPARAQGIFIQISWPICESATTYYFNLPCGQGNPVCTVDVTRLDGPRALTPLAVEVDTSVDGGLVPVPCPANDAGVYACEGIQWGGPGSVQQVRVRPDVDAGAGPLPASEYVLIRGR